MKKLLNTIITIIIRYKSYLFKPKDKFSEIIKIEELFIRTSLKLLKKDSFRLFDINIVLENKKDIDLLYRLKQEFHIYKKDSIIYEPENLIQKKILNLLVTPMSEETFKINFLNIMGKSLKKLIVQKQKKNFQLYLSEELNYLLLNTLPLKDVLNYLEELYKLLNKDPLQFFVYFKHLDQDQFKKINSNNLDNSDKKYNIEDTIALQKDLEESIFRYLFEYEELEENFNKKPNFNLQSYKPNQLNQSNQSKITLKRNFKDDNISVFFKDTFNLLEYKPFIRKR